MSIKDSLWKVDIPFRLLSYLALYVGLIISMVSFFCHLYEIKILLVGVAMILLSTSYLSVVVFCAGFRWHALVLFFLILILCAIPILGMLIYHTECTTF